MPSDQTFVIVGASLGGAKAAETLREEGFDGRVVLIGAEDERPYERPPLSKDYLRGEAGRDKVYVHDEAFYAEHDIELRLGPPARRRRHGARPDGRAARARAGHRGRRDLSRHPHRQRRADADGHRHRRLRGSDIRRAGAHERRSRARLRLPYFFSDQYDVGMEYAGIARAWDRVVFRGDPAGREFIAFWVAGDRLVAGMNLNVWDVTDEIQQLIRERVAVDDQRLADPEIPLSSLHEEALHGCHHTS